jgi:hypothetical protein
MEVWMMRILCRLMLKAVQSVTGPLLKKINSHQKKGAALLYLDPLWQYEYLLLTLLISSCQIIVLLELQQKEATMHVE